MNEGGEDLDYGSDENNNQQQSGKLKMSDVQNLAADADVVIDSLKGVDYSFQDLDVLIELARQLKVKREAMFPENTSILLNDALAEAN